MPEPSSSALAGAGLEISRVGAAATTAVVSVSVTGVVTSSDSAEAVFTMSPPASAMVTTYVPVSVQVAPTGTFAHVFEFGVINGSETTTLVWATLPVFVAVIV